MDHKHQQLLPMVRQLVGTIKAKIRLQVAYTHIVELQGDWIGNAIDWCVKNNKKTIDPTAQSEAEWTKHVADLCDITLFPGTQGWYMGTNIPGKPRESLNYTGGILRYVRETREVVDKGYVGFRFDAPYDTKVKA